MKVYTYLFRYDDGRALVSSCVFVSTVIGFVSICCQQWYQGENWKLHWLMTMVVRWVRWAGEMGTSYSCELIAREGKLVNEKGMNEEKMWKRSIGTGCWLVPAAEFLLALSPLPLPIFREVLKFLNIPKLARCKNWLLFQHMPNWLLHKIIIVTLLIVEFWHFSALWCVVDNVNKSFREFLKS